MLVLSRKVGERIVVGDDIEVVVCGIQRDRVKLGFAAPEHIRIVRKELMEKPAKTVEISRGSHEGPGAAKAIDHGVQFTVS